MLTFLNETRRAYRRLLFVTLTAGAGFSLLGCSSPPPPSQPPTAESMRSLIGKTVSEAKRSFPNLISPLYDLSSPIVHVAGSYTTSSDDQFWVIVNACAAEKPSVGNIAVGLIPAELATSELRRLAQKGTFRDLMVECKG